jgi:hypothetical protein
MAHTGDAALRPIASDVIELRLSTGEIFLLGEDYIERLA